MSNITIKDVAKAANVSIATVSRVLNKNKKVNPEISRKVNAAIDELGYFPNNAARTLKGDNTKTIAFIASDISNFFFTTMARSIEDVLNNNGYNLIVCSTDDSQERELGYLQLLRVKHVDGIIINMTARNTKYIASLSQDMPIALFGRSITDAAFHGDFVDNDNEDGIYRLTNLLIDDGHRRIGMINGQSYVSSAQERLRGYRKALSQHGIGLSDDYLYTGHFNSPATAEAGAAKLLSLPEPPTAIIASNNILSIGVMSYCRKNNIAIPDDISLCSFGSLEEYGLLYVQPTFADQTPALMGAKLAEMIIQRINAKNKLSNREVRFIPPISIGNSVKSIPE